MPSPIVTLPGSCFRHPQAGRSADDGSSGAERPPVSGLASCAALHSPRDNSVSGDNPVASQTLSLDEAGVYAVIQEQAQIIEQLSAQVARVRSENAQLRRALESTSWCPAPPHGDKSSRASGSHVEYQSFRGVGKYASSPCVPQLCLPLASFARAPGCMVPVPPIDSDLSEQSRLSETSVSRQRSTPSRPVHTGPPPHPPATPTAPCTVNSSCTSRVENIDDPCGSPMFSSFRGRTTPRPPPSPCRAQPGGVAPSAASLVPARPHAPHSSSSQGALLSPRPTAGGSFCASDHAFRHRNGSFPTLVSQDADAGAAELPVSRCGTDPRLSPSMPRALRAHSSPEARPPRLPREEAPGPPTTVRRVSLLVEPLVLSAAISELRTEPAGAEGGPRSRRARKRSGAQPGPQLLTEMLSSPSSPTRSPRSEPSEDDECATATLRVPFLDFSPYGSPQTTPQEVSPRSGP
eukprot:TRINITY_DN8141_c0_g1_i1.p1 TRINITY_DN8141_c0_g1~~TRINITY_DN8141_c0_g1_i1.p1  ORF type:complete len:486 (+),score=53.76 TRINITY_DN8141_c0_g1_i1:72-1460(+)